MFEVPQKRLSNSRAMDNEDFCAYQELLVSEIVDVVIVRIMEEKMTANSQNDDIGTSKFFNWFQTFLTASVPPCIPTTAPDIIQCGSSGGLPIVSVKYSTISAATAAETKACPGLVDHKGLAC
ncbi:hypothetical protein Leryth_009126 [Lithospermum erythrorhizon]|nr:hypothetical protein Leryth_009126 [Lithospermum erythrorhizon]